MKTVGINIVVERDSADKKSVGGIVIPDNARAAQQPWTGTVCAVGSGFITKTGVRVAPECKVGDRVIVSRILAEDFALDGKEYIATTEDKVLAIIEAGAKVEDMR